MEDESEWRKLPIDECCVHKVWKARVYGYEEAAKLFKKLDDEKSPEWNKYLGLIKKFVIDSHAMAQEKGLEAALIFVENCGHAGKTVGEVMSGIVTKCLGAPKAKTKELGMQVALMYVEIERHEQAIDELIKGFENKNPKILLSCVSTVLQALREFGSKVVNVKPLVKKIPQLLSDRDKLVRDEAKQLTVEIFRWIGPVFKTQIQSVPQVTLTELEAEFEKVKNDRAVPTRYLKSQQEKITLEAVVADNGDEEDGDEDAPQREEMDPMDLIDPVEILSKIPKDFYEKLEAKKWTDRKEALEAVEKLVSNPKIENGDFGELVRALKKVITKDTNVVLVALAGKCLALLAKGLSKKFQPYAVVCIGGIIEKFKEKKANVVTALREAMDAIYPSTNLEAIQEDMLVGLANKNPSVKNETALFLARSFTKTLPTVLNKKLLKVYVTALLKTLNEPDPGVREASAEALGTAMKLVGEKNISPFLTEVDALKMEKIKEYHEKAVIVVKIPGGAKKEVQQRPQTAPVRAEVKKGGSNEPKAVSRPTTAKSAATRKPSANASAGVSKSASTKNVLPTERELTPEEVDEQVSEILPADVVSGLVDSNWKTRLSSIESFLQNLSSFDAKCGHTQVFVRVLAKKPGLKDTNFQVLKLRLDAIKNIADSFGMTVTSADFIINEITEKLSDPKVSASATAALTSIAEAIRLEYVVSKVMSFAFEQKSPKVQQEAISWVNNAIREFGFQVNPKLLIDDAKKGVNSTNPVVRQAAIGLLGTMHLYMGPTLAMFFDNEKPALKQQIQQEFDKNAGQKPPPALKGGQARNSSSTDNIGDDEDEPQSPSTNITDLLPRVDISPFMNESAIAELSDKNWKTRNEGLEKLKSILNEHKLIKPTLGELPPVLAQRLVDSNAKIAQTAVEICSQLATSIGPGCKQHIRVLLPGILRGLGDNKAYLRQACIACMNTWGEQCGYKEFFDGEMFADALKSGTPALKVEIWGWLAEKLPNIPPKTINKEELIACMPHLYANIIDRNAEVRKNANDCVLGVMMHVGYDAMMKAMERQKPATKKDIQAALDKARPNLPVKPLPKSKNAPIVEEPKAVRGGGVSKVAKAAVSKPGSAPAGTSRKKEEETDNSPTFAVNNLKQQRCIDEQKLKVLRWSFTTPREEFTDLLKEQMTTANVNKTLMANMFHDDFRFHLRVIETLNEDLPSNTQGQICNLDLILKWLSLRFYDTNPSVLLKGLDYLNHMVQKLIQLSQPLTDNEGSSFIPHLLTKIGDPKDLVRNSVRQILRQICLVYQFSKVFSFLMDALKSKNARQRTECLDELGYLIETYNLAACQPTPQAALKEIAKQISDRDNSVRSAALNCIVKAYELAGERIYKMIGQLSEKDLSMLDERIKRSKKSPKVQVEVKQSNVEIVSVVQEDPRGDYSGGEEELPSEEEPAPRNNDDETEDDQSNEQKVNQTMKLNSPEWPALPQNQMIYEPAPVTSQRAPSGPFGLDGDIIAEIEKDWIRCDQIKMTHFSPIDLTFTEQPLKTKIINGVSYPTERLNHLTLNKSPSRPHSANVTLYSASSPQQHFTSPLQSHRPATAPAADPVPNLFESLPKYDSKLLNIIKGIGHPDQYVAHASLNELSDIIESQEKQAVLRDYEEIYIQCVLGQFKHLSQRPISEAVALYQPLLNSIYHFFSSKTLGQNLSVVSIKNIISVLLGLMSDQKLGNGEEYTKVINSICLKILDRCNFTNLNCALVRLLRETCQSSALPKFTELLMKCIWRNVKLMPERVNELDYDALLMEIHDFMLALPTTWWANRPSDTPMRTIKTIIHNMTKLKGAGIIQHLNNIPKHSELNTYVLRIIKKEQIPMPNNTAEVNQTFVSQQHQQRSQQDRVNRATHDQVSNIFKLISDKETSKQGLKQLYEFKENHPEVDIQPFLKGVSPYFQQFINDGLADLQSASQNCTNNNASGDHGTAMRAQGTETSSSNPDYWMQKLNMYKIRGKLQSEEDDRSPLMDNKIADENLNVNQMQRMTSSTGNKKDAAHIPADRLELLQQKLAQYKQK